MYKICHTEESSRRQLQIPRKTFYRYFPSKEDCLLALIDHTLASSDYGFLQHDTFEPRPNYWAVLLWNTLMGKIVDGTVEIAPGSCAFIVL